MLQTTQKTALHKIRLISGRNYLHPLGFTSADSICNKTKRNDGPVFATITKLPNSSKPLH